MANDYEGIAGSGAAVMLNAGLPDQVFLTGINKLAGYSMERATIEFKQFRSEISRKQSGTGSLNDIPISGYAVFNTAAKLLKKYYRLQTKVTTMRLYLTEDIFFMPDLATDPTSFFQVSKFGIGDFDQDSPIPFDGTLLMGGYPAMFVNHLKASTIAITPDAGGDKIIDSASGFIEAGAEVGDTVILQGVAETADNLTQHKIASVAAGEIVLETVSTLTAEAEGSEIELHFGAL